MSATDAIILAVILIIVVAVVLKLTVFNGPKWYRDQERQKKKNRRTNN